MNLKEFCGGEEFYNSTLFFTANPEFSNCFERIVFDLVPTAFLFVFGILYFLSKRKSNESHIPVSSLFISKFIVTTLLWLLSWASFGRGLWEWLNSVYVPLVDLVSALLLSTGMALAAFFLHFDRIKGIRTSSLLTCFWILYLVTWALVFKSQVERLMHDQPLTDGEVWRTVIFFISYACVLIQVILSFVVDKLPALPPRDPYAEDDEAVNVDQEKETTRKPCPERSSSFLSKMMFEWFTRIIFNGYKRPLVDGDLFDLNRDDKAGRVSRRFLRIWNAEKKKYANRQRSESSASDSPLGTTDQDVLIEQPSEKKQKGPSLFLALCKAYGPYFLVGTFLKVLNDVLTFVSPQLLKAMISYTNSSNTYLWQGYVLAALMFVTAILQSIVLQQYFHVCFVSGMRLRSGIIAAIYRKALVLSNSARKESTVGEVVNLMSVDAQRFMDLMSYINIIWSGPFQIILAMYFLWQTMGPSTLAGLGVMVLLIPVNGFIASKAHKFQISQMKHKDERIKLMNEILNGIKVLKMYAWELSFRDKVTLIRGKELKVLRSAAYLNAAASFTWTCAPFLVSLTTFAVYVLSDPSHILDAEKAFVAISLFNILQFPLIMLPVMVSSLVQAHVSLKRMQKFLGNDELDLGNVDHSPGNGPVISIKDGVFAWDNTDEPILNDISLSVPKGSLVAVVGQVGCGKSSLVSALLGEMEKVSGNVSVKGSIAYVAQQAWIQNLTVRDNITFGKRMDACKYQDTIDACELKEDFEMLPGGDLTEIGERGINLSGGQKQRVSIARAVYQDADVYLFDDPLSAVDAHVGKNIFENVLGPQGCLNRTTRILVTHGVSFLPQVDQIVVLVNGRISEVGTYSELQEKNGDFAEFLKNYANNEEDEEEYEEEIEVSTPPLSSSVIEDSSLEPVIEEEKLAATIAARQFQRQQSRKSMSEAAVYGPTCKVRVRKKSEKDRVCELPKKKINDADDKLITEETAETGNVKKSVFVSYMKSIGYIVCFFITFTYVASNGMAVSSSIWLADWTSKPPNNTDTGYELGVYGALGISRALFVLCSSFLISYGSVLASSHLHFKVLDNILKAPMSFFDTTPLGRIVNRFSKDIYLIDEVVPRSLSAFMRTFFMTVSTFFVIIFSTPIFAAVVVPILILYWFVQRFYVRTSRQLKRLESISRSPIYSHFGETLAGSSTIRAYSLQKSFIRQNEQKVDTNQMAYYPNIVSNRWLALRLEIVGNLIVLFAAIFAVLAKGSIQPGYVGLSISYAMQITSIMNWMVRTASEVETNIVAVERVEEYAAVEQEAALEITEQTPSDSWPRNGEIKFDNYSTRYREELDLVVRDITIDIQGGEKIGVVGRTGAGKSSLTLALFRIIEAAEGQIRIDGVNISKIGLHSLRSKISIIPQDPVLFSGTLRMNLDPFETYSDDELWDALEHAHLKAFVSTLATKLDHPVSEGGENLSVGQRQLVCLARALLRKSKILVLDEATAAVDLETDDLIQATIRDQFRTSTTFTIAHRLNTIMDSTRVLVLDAGKVAEYDTPGNLLQAKGIFYSMAKDAGLA